MLFSCSFDKIKQNNFHVGTIQTLTSVCTYYSLVLFILKSGILVFQRLQSWELTILLPARASSADAIENNNNVRFFAVAWRSRNGGGPAGLMCRY